MAKSLRSKWKRKMRAIKREKMDVKVLARMNKMLVASVAEQKLDAQEEKLMQKRKLQKEGVAEEVIEAKLAAIDPPIGKARKKFQIYFIQYIYSDFVLFRCHSGVHGSSRGIRLCDHR
jgi:hypothetical protein